MNGTRLLWTHLIDWFCEIAVDVVDCFVAHDRVQSAYGVSNALQIVTRFGHSANATTRLVEVER